MTKLLSQSEYAAHRGVSRAAVCQAVKAGRITLIDGKVDPAVADAEWGGKTAARVRVSARVETPAPVAVLAAAPVAPPPPPPPRQAQQSDSDYDRPDYMLERARRERAEANISEMKAAELAGELVRLEDVRRKWDTISSRAKQALMQLPDRLAPVLENRSQAFIRETVEVEVRKALHGLEGAA